MKMERKNIKLSDLQWVVETESKLFLHKTWDEAMHHARKSLDPKVYPYLEMEEYECVLTMGLLEKKEK